MVEGGFKNLNNTKQPNSNIVGTLLKLGLGGLIVWRLIPPEIKEKTRRFLKELDDELAAAQRRQAELKNQQRIIQALADVFPKHPSSSNILQTSQDLPSPQYSPDSPVTWMKESPLVSSNATYTKVYIEPDALWLKKILHPSVVLILGKRGSGKSALAYRIMELFRFGPKPYVVGVPASKRHLLPEWIGIATCLEVVPMGAIIIIDEAYLLFHARGSTAQESKEMSKLVNLSRQKEQTIIFVSQEARQIDKNIASSANVIIFKDLGILQLQFERPEFNNLATKAKEAFASINGEKRRWSYLYAPDTDFSGLIENELPSFWKPSLSRMFAGEVSEVSKTSKPRGTKKLSPAEKAQKAKELRGQGASYSEISITLGVSLGTVVNYIKGYPYKDK